MFWRETPAPCSIPRRTLKPMFLIDNYGRRVVCIACRKATASKAGGAGTEQYKGVYNVYVNYNGEEYKLATATISGQRKESI